MDWTESWRGVLPAGVVERYDIREIRNAARVFQATNPERFAEVVEVLEGFSLTRDDVTQAGGGKSMPAKRLDEAFRERGWREVRHDTTVHSVLKVMPYAKAGEKKAVIRETVIASEAYKVDNVKDRVVVDVEWNAKDGNLDRDLGAYRALYEAGIIDCGVIITRTLDLRELSKAFGIVKFDTTTTTNLSKLEPRMTRGDAGGCPVLAVAISPRCYDGPMP